MLLTRTTIGLHGREDGPGDHGATIKDVVNATVRGGYCPMGLTARMFAGQRLSNVLSSHRAEKAGRDGVHESPHNTDRAVALVSNVLARPEKVVGR